MIEDYSLVVVSPGQLSRDLGGETVILHLDAGAYFGLEGVGTRVWELIQERRTVAEIRDRLLEEYDVDRPRCHDDLQTLLQALADNGLIEVTSPQ